MILGITKEIKGGETRVAITPTGVKQLKLKGIDCFFESDSGLKSQFTNQDYLDAGAILKEQEVIFKESDVLVKINPFEENEIQKMKKGQVTISKLYHHSEPDYLKSLISNGISAFSLDAMPRITRAQDMDVLSSQNNLAGYKAVIKGAYEMTKIFPLMMTAAGTITPSRVLIYGVGVAGLQAIATAKRLGAIVEATDIRMETKEQTESLGAKFISVENNTETSEGGYAKEASEDYKQRQKEAVNESLFKADLVITTAHVPGKKAPMLISEEQVKKMKTGAVIIDLAATHGGNCEISEFGKMIEKYGVKIVGTTIAPTSVATNASELFGKNIYNFLMHLVDENGFKWDLEEEITNCTLIIHNGENRKK